MNDLSKLFLAIFVLSSAILAVLTVEFTRTTKPTFRASISNFEIKNASTSPVDLGRKENVNSIGDYIIYEEPLPQ